MSSRIPMYDSTGRHKDSNHYVKARRFQQLGQTEKALVDIPDDLLPTSYNPTGQENMDQQKLPKPQNHGNLLCLEMLTIISSTMTFS
jgi:hypothetical protein